MLYDSFKLKFKNMQLMCTEENSQVGYHNHAEFEILIITKGNPEIIVGDKTYNVKKGDLLITMGAGNVVTIGEDLLKK